MSLILTYFADEIPGKYYPDYMINHLAEPHHSGINHVCFNADTGGCPLSRGYLANTAAAAEDIIAWLASFASVVNVSSERAAVNRYDYECPKTQTRQHF